MVIVQVPENKDRKETKNPLLLTGLYSCYSVVLGDVDCN